MCKVVTWRHLKTMNGDAVWDTYKSVIFTVFECALWNLFLQWDHTKRARFGEADSWPWTLHDKRNPAKTIHQIGCVNDVQIMWAISVVNGLLILITWHFKNIFVNIRTVDRLYRWHESQDNCTATCRSWQHWRKCLCCNLKSRYEMSIVQRRPHDNGA